MTTENVARSQTAPQDFSPLACLRAALDDHGPPTTTARLVYCALVRRAHTHSDKCRAGCSYGGRCFPGLDRIAADTGLSRKGARTGMRALAESGWIRVDSTEGLVNVYWILVPPVTHGHGSPTVTGNPGTREGVTQGDDHPSPTVTRTTQGTAQPTTHPRKRAPAPGEVVASGVSDVLQKVPVAHKVGANDVPRRRSGSDDAAIAEVMEIWRVECRRLRSEVYEVVATDRDYACKVLIAGRSAEATREPKHPALAWVRLWMRLYLGEDQRDGWLLCRLPSRLGKYGGKVPGGAKVRAVQVVEPEVPIDPVANREAARAAQAALNKLLTQSLVPMPIAL